MVPKSTGAVSSMVLALLAGLELMTPDWERPLGRTARSWHYQAEDSGWGKQGHARCGEALSGL